MEMDLRERIEAKFIPEPNSGCFLWFGSLNTSGYPQISVNKKLSLAHRIYYEMERGPIPPGLVIDHLCRNPCCVNPDHLEPVTIFENSWVRAIRTPKQFCPRGHEYTPENTFRYSGRRICKICKREQWKNSAKRWRQRHALQKNRR
jgi:hypothetical protein